MYSYVNVCVWGRFYEDRYRKQRKTICVHVRTNSPANCLSDFAVGVRVQYELRYCTPA